MISIITAIHNQYAMNVLFWENLKNNTYHAFELIVIDNKSNDDSANFFESVGATVVRNPGNYSYPYSQNQGIQLARYDWLGFLNNDIIVAPHWDNILLTNMLHNRLEVATCCGIEQIENAAATKKLKRRWQRIKNLVGLFGYSQRTLRLMHRWMYGDWAQFCEQRQQQFALATKEGFVGNTVMMQRSALAKIGLWDERLQGADFDLYLRTKSRADTVGDIEPMKICLDVFNHHYIRLTAKAKYPRFVDFDKLIRLEDKWSTADLALLKRLNT